MKPRQDGTPRRHTPPRVVRVPDDIWNAAKITAAAKGETVSDVLRKALVSYVRRGGVVLLAALALTACGAADDATSPVAERTAVVATSVPVETSEAVAAVSGEAIGTDQNLRIGGEIVGRVALLSVDPADFGATVQVNNIAPMTVDAADFVLIDADGSEIVGAAAVEAWDRVLGPNDQTIGPVAFAGATAPAFIVYSPAGADQPLIWAF